VLSNFAFAGRLDLIIFRYKGTGIITSEVLDEIAAGVSRGYRELQDVERIVADGSLEQAVMNTEERQDYATLLKNLDSGEASCIAIAKSKSAVVVTDDMMAREICSELGVQVTGTIGILKALWKEETLSDEEADELLDRMIERGFYSPVKRISE